MSCPKSVTPKFDITDLIAAWICAGGVDPNNVIKEQPLGLEKRDVFYSFWLHPGFSVEGSVYWIQEGKQLRQFLWLELAIVKLEESTRAAAMEFALTRSHSFPSPFKIGLSEDLIVLALRFPVDGLTPEYLRDLIYSIGPSSTRLYDEINTLFKLPHLMDAQKAEGLSGRTH